MQSCGLLLRYSCGAFVPNGLLKSHLPSCLCPSPLFSHLQKQITTEIQKAWATAYVLGGQTGSGSHGWRRLMTVLLRRWQWKVWRNGWSMSWAFRPSMPSALDPGAAQCWAKLKSQVTHEHNISIKLASRKAASLKPLKIIVQLFF